MTIPLALTLALAPLAVLPGPYRIEGEIENGYPGWLTLRNPVDGLTRNSSGDFI